MTSVSAFNEMMGQFLMELHKTFPEEKGLKKCISAFELMKDTNPKLVVDGFMSGVTPYADKISSKDETFFINESKNLDFMKDVNLEKHWSSCSENTKNAIWQYVQTLYMLGTTIKSIPEDTLSMIETVAKQCADKMGEDGTSMDENALMKTMQGMLGGMLGGNKK
jgi:predicted ATPase